MPKKLQKSLKECLFKIKSPNPATKKWILSGCKHPKTQSFAIDGTRKLDNHHQQQEQHSGPAATLSDIDRFLLENFKSLYIKNEDEDHNQNAKVAEEEHDEEETDSDQEAKSPGGGVLFDSPRLVEPPLLLCGSHRFFVHAGSSSSLMEEARLSLTTTTTSTSGEGSTSTRSSSNITTTDAKNNLTGSTIPDDYIAVKTYSKSPSDDFRRSMQEMVETRIQEQADHKKVDWDFMQELLFCYLNLNEKNSHKFILSAFVDVIVGLRQRSNNNNNNRAPVRLRRSSSRRERRRKLRNVT